MSDPDPDGHLTLATERLRLHVYVLDDLDRLAALYGNPEVATRTKLGMRTREQCRNILDDYLQCWRHHGFGMRIVTDQTGAAIGECGLFHTTSRYTPAIRYVFDNAYWGLGYASEAVAATIGDGFSRLGLERIYGFVESENRASHRVVAKAGFRLEDVTDSPKGRLFRYVLDRDG